MAKNPTWLDRAFGAFESGAVSFLDWSITSLAGGLIDSLAGRGGDGVFGSSAEDYLRPDGAAAVPNIHIHGNLKQAEAPPAQEPAPAQPLAEAAPVQEDGAAWFARVHAEAVHGAAEQRAAQDIGEGREQSLFAVAVDPVGHYARQDAVFEQRQAEDAAFNRAMAEVQHEQEQAQGQRP